MSCSQFKDKLIVCGNLLSTLYPLLLEVLRSRCLKHLPGQALLSQLARAGAALVVVQEFAALRAVHRWVLVLPLCASIRPHWIGGGISMHAGVVDQLSASVADQHIASVADQHSAARICTCLLACPLMWAAANKHC